MNEERLKQTVQCVISRGVSASNPPHPHLLINQHTKTGNYIYNSCCFIYNVKLLDTSNYVYQIDR